jgi:hypothetical protein
VWDFDVTLYVLQDVALGTAIDVERPYGTGWLEPLSGKYKFHGASLSDGISRK